MAMSFNFVLPFTREGIYVTNNQFLKAGPKGRTQSCNCIHTIHIPNQLKTTSFARMSKSGSSRGNMSQGSSGSDVPNNPPPIQGVYATNNQFLKAGPKGFIQVKVLENDSLHVRVDLPGVPDDGVRHRVDAVRKKLVFFSGETPAGNQREGVREYSGSAGLGCDCCEITGVDAKMKDGVLRMIVSRVKVKDHDKKCTHTVPPNAGKSGRHLEDHPFLVKGHKGAVVGVPLPGDGLYFAVDIPGVCCDDVEVLANEHEVRFYAEVKNVDEHDESGRVYLGRVISCSSSSDPLPSILTQTIAYDAEFGVLKIVIAPRNSTNSE